MSKQIREVEPSYGPEQEECEPSIVYYGTMWAAIPEDVLFSKNLSAIDVRVYGVLRLRAGKAKYVWYGVPSLAKELGLSEASIKASFKHLSDDNWIRRHRRLGATSLTYVFERQSDCLSFDPQLATTIDDVSYDDRQSNSDEDSSLNTYILNKDIIKHININAQGEENSHTSLPEEEVIPPPVDPIKEIEEVAYKYPKPLALKRSSTVEAFRRGREQDYAIKEEFEKTFHITPNWDARYGREFLGWLKDRPPNETIGQFASWWYSADWRGKTGQPPTIGQVTTLWPQAFEQYQNPMNRPTEVY